MIRATEHRCCLALSQLHVSREVLHVQSDDWRLPLYLSSLICHGASVYMNLPSALRTVAPAVSEMRVSTHHFHAGDFTSCFVRDCPHGFFPSFVGGVVLSKAYGKTGESASSVKNEIMRSRHDGAGIAGMRMTASASVFVSIMERY